MRFLPFLAVLLFLTSCSIVPSLPQNNNKKNPIPDVPNKTFASREDLKKNSSVIQDIANHVDNNGAIAHSTVTGTLKDCADILVMTEGLPAEKIDWRIKEQVVELHKKIKADEKQYREDMDAWMIRIDELSRNNDILASEIKQKNGIIASLTWWFWFFVIVLAVITFLCPTVGFGIIRFVANRAKNLAQVTLTQAHDAFDSQYKQFIKAVDEYSIKHPEEAEKLKGLLSKHMDSTTKRKVAELKTK